MSESSKSPLKVLQVAYRLALKSLPEYSHRFSPKKYSQAQLFGCLVLKMFFKTDYRGLEAILRDSPNLCSAMGMKEAPHYTTVQKAQQRMLKKKAVAKLLEESLFFGTEEKANN